MRIETPPQTTDVSLAAYLTRMFNNVLNELNSNRNIVVTTSISNPQRGKLYFVDTLGLPQFPTKGVYYFNGTNFIKLQEV
jgi:hypothetical protein